MSCSPYCGLRLSLPVICTIILLNGCAGPSIEVTAGSDHLEQACETPRFSLPTPSELRLPSGVVSEYLKLGADFEQDLPHQNVTVDGDLLQLACSWESGPRDLAGLAYACYWLRIPEYLRWEYVQCEYSRDDRSLTHVTVWGGIADFTENTWQWGDYAAQFDFDENNMRDGHLLVVLVVTRGIVNLEWLVAGDTTPPFVYDVDPNIFMTGTEVQFHYSTWEPVGTILWQWPAGITPSTSTESSPIVLATDPGEFTGTLTLSNAIGEVAYGFPYEVVAETEFAPLYLYAIPEVTEVQTGEEVLVRVVSGDFSMDDPFCSCSVALTVSEAGEYVAGSLNAGAPGGAKYEMDGLWEQMVGHAGGFLDTDIDIKPRPTEEPGVSYLQFVMAPVYPIEVAGGGDVFNIRLRFDEPGEYKLGFLRFHSVARTKYEAYEGGSQFWLDIGNSTSPAIVVLPTD